MGIALVCLWFALEQGQKACPLAVAAFSQVRIPKGNIVREVLVMLLALEVFFLLETMPETIAQCQVLIASHQGSRAWRRPPRAESGQVLGEQGAGVGLSWVKLGNLPSKISCYEGRPRLYMTWGSQGDTCWSAGVLGCDGS